MISDKTLMTGNLYKKVLQDFPDVLNVMEVSKILSISSKTVYRLINDGLLTAIKVGRAFRIPKLYLLQYLNLDQLVHIKEEPKQ